MSAVRIESDAWNDWRFTALGAALYPAMDRADATDLAMLRFFRLVSQCTDRDTYFLPIEAADAICGSGFARALITCGLGEQVEEGTVRVRGTGGRIEWLAKKRKAGRKGGKVSGKSRAQKAEAQPKQPAKHNTESASPKSNPTATATATATALLFPEETSPVPGGVGLPDLEAVYQLYPRKEGKGDGLAKARKAIRTPSDLEAFRLAVTNYAAKMRAENREMRHIKAFDSFMSAWRDYLDPAVAATDTPAPPSSATGYVKVTGREQYRGGDVEDF